MYQHPGVYIVHVPSGVLAIEAASTSVAAFIGQLRRGELVTADSGEPVFISNATQFANRFGALTNTAGGIWDEGETADFFGFAVNAFFANGGTKAYIVPVADGNGDPATAALVDPNDATKGFYFTARPEGAWANGLFAAIAVTVDDPDPANREYTLSFGLKNDKGKLEPIEVFTGLRLNPASSQFLVPKVNNGSTLATVEHLDIAGAGGGQFAAQLSAPLGGLDLTTITAADAITIVVDGSNVPVAFDGTDATLEELAATIQETVRNHVPANTGTQGFIAEVTLDRRLLLIPGGGAATPTVSMLGNATAVKLGLDPTAYLGAAVAAVDEAELDGGTIDLTVGGAPVAVVLALPIPDLAAVATQIQAAADAVPIADFSATVSSSRLLLRVDGGDTADAVDVPGGTAIGDLGLDDAGATGMRPVDLDYPQPFDAATQRAEALFAGGVDHGSPGDAEYEAALLRLRDYRDISIILLPGQHWIQPPGGDNSVIEAAITHSEFMKNRMVVVDPPDPGEGIRLETPTNVKDLAAPTSPYAALYYPWLVVSNPHYDPDTAANKPKTFAIPPSAFAAGLWARIDNSRGVWKAPAGLEAEVRGANGPNVRIGNDVQDNLNEWGVNCLRSIIGPTVIWGARTLATKTKPEFRYVPVRRTQNMIGESFYNALQSVVFEPNDHRLWASIRGSVGNFMDGLHRAGAFQGEKKSDAFFVLCGLGSTMTQGDIDAGIVRVVVGFAPLKPAEFVIVEIKQIVGQTA